MTKDLKSSIGFSTSFLQLFFFNPSFSLKELKNSFVLCFEKFIALFLFLITKQIDSH